MFAPGTRAASGQVAEGGGEGAGELVSVFFAPDQGRPDLEDRAGWAGPAG
jgi:hypothetical protein